MEKDICQASYYHGGMDQNTRVLIQEQFIHNQLDVICATSAFGMGVNKENIRFVIHYHMPMQIESYLQEIGRAGRDGKRSVAILVYASGDELLPLQLIESELPTEQQIDWLFSKMANGKIVETESNLLDKNLQEQGGFSEVQWRIIEEFFKHPVQGSQLSELKRTIQEFVKERLAVKKNNIYRMKQWLDTKRCRREVILNYFDEHLFEKVQSCCDRCGIQLTEYMAAKPDTRSETKKATWNEYLAKLLISGGLRE